MKRQLLVGSMTLFVVAGTFGRHSTIASVQSAFASASIAPAPASTTDSGAFRLGPSGAFTARNATLRELVEYAYQHHAWDRPEVEGGPAWADTDRFNVEANAVGEHTVDADGAFSQTWSMLRTLLTDRFKLKVHEESRARPVYALRLARSDRTVGPKLQRTNVDCGAMMKRVGPPSSDKGPPCSQKTPPGRLFVNTASMATIASLLSRHVDRTVVDRTGLTGRFDLELEAADIKAADDYKPGPSDLALPPARGPSIFVAVQEQLGLKLEPENGAVPILVIDHAERPAFD